MGDVGGEFRSEVQVLHVHVREVPTAESTMADAASDINSCFRVPCLVVEGNIIREMQERAGAKFPSLVHSHSHCDWLWTSGGTCFTEVVCYIKHSNLCVLGSTAS